MVGRRQPAYRVPLCRRRLRAHAGSCEGAGGAQAGLRSRSEHPGCRGVDAGHTGHSYRVRRCVRSDWERVCREHGATGRQHHRIHGPAREHRREISRDVERDGAAARPCGHHVQSEFRARCWQVFFSSVYRVRDKLKVHPIIAEVHYPSQIENAIKNLGTESGSGLVVVPDNFMSVHRDLIISLTTQFRIPAIYPYRYFAEAGGLVSYGVDAIDQFRRASEYVSRILRGAQPADLPVQAPTKFELVINVKTAKALGIVIPRILLAGAEQVIE